MKLPDKITYGELKAMDDKTLKKYTSAFGYACYLYAMRLMDKGKETKAYYYFHKGSNFNCYECDSYLGNVYFAMKDYKNALKHLYKACNNEKANDHDFLNLGLCYFNGYGTQVNLYFAKLYFTKSFEKYQSPRTALYVAESILKATNNIDYKTAFYYVEQSVILDTNRLLPSKKILAYLYENGFGVERNLRKAFELYADVIDPNHKIETEKYADIFMYYYEHDMDEYIKTSISIKNNDYTLPVISKFINDNLEYKSADVFLNMDDPKDPYQVCRHICHQYELGNFALFAFMYENNNKQLLCIQPKIDKQFDRDYGEILFAIGLMYEEGIVFTRDVRKACIYYGCGSDYGSEKCKKKHKELNALINKERKYYAEDGNYCTPCDEQEFMPIINALIADPNAHVKDLIEERCAFNDEADVYFTIAFILLKLNKKDNLDLIIKYASIAADLGSAPAMSILARRYLFAKNDIEKATELAERLISQNELFGYETMGMIYQYGLKDYEKAKEYYDISMKMGSLVSASHLAEMYFYKQLPPISLSEFVKLLKFAYKLYDGIPAETLGGIYEFRYEELGIPLDYKKIEECYLYAANRGQKISAYRLARMYRDGYPGVGRSDAAAERWFRKAIELGHLPSYYYLGRMLEKQNRYKEAFDIYLEGANKGSGDCANLVGCYYDKEYKKVPMDRDLDEAMKWFLKAAELGSSYGMRNVGVLYEYKKNPKEAEIWYKKAVEKGNGLACVDLAQVYIKEHHDYKTAIEYYMLGVERGNLNSIYDLAKIYEEGNYVLIDYKKSEEYYQLAIKNGYKSKTFEQEHQDLLKKKSMYDSLMKNIVMLKDVCETSKSVSATFKLFEIYDRYAPKREVDDKDENGQPLELTPEQLETRRLERRHYYLYLAAERNHALANQIIGDELYKESKLEEALEYYQKAYDFGITSLDTLIKEIEEKIHIIENEKLDIDGEIDFFVSWCVRDIDFKNKLVQQMSDAGYYAWNSDHDGAGRLKENVKSVIARAKGFIIILSEEAIRHSNYMKNEIDWILEHVKDENNQLNSTLIKLVLKDDISKVLKEDDIDVNFKNLAELCFDFSKLEDSIVEYEKEPLLTFAERIRKVFALRQYQQNLVNEFDTFTISLNKMYLSEKRISPSLDLEKAYINRGLFDDSGKTYEIKDLKELTTPALIYGDGGTGKTLYFKHMIRVDHDFNNLYFLLSAREVNKKFKSKDLSLLKILKQFCFKDELYPNIDEKIIKDILDSTQKNIFVIFDGLDETPVENREKIARLMKDYSSKKNMHFLLSSRNKLDIDNIGKELERDILPLGIEQLTDEDIEGLFNSFIKRNFDQMDDTERNLINKDYFLREIKDMEEDIKKNPLLISIIIYIYFANHEVKKHRIDILETANDVITNHLEKERKMNEIQDKILQYLDLPSITEFLEYIAYYDYVYPNLTVEDVVMKYLVNKGESGNALTTNAKMINDYLINRKFIVEGHFTHQIFASFYAGRYLYYQIYKNKYESDHLEYKNRNFLLEESEKYFLIENDYWPNVVLDFICKIDLQLYHFSNGAKTVGAYSYQTFIDTFNR